MPTSTGPPSGQPSVTTGSARTPLSTRRRGSGSASASRRSRRNRCQLSRCRLPAFRRRVGCTNSVTSQDRSICGDRVYVPTGWGFWLRLEDGRNLHFWALAGPPRRRRSPPLWCCGTAGKLDPAPLQAARSYWWMRPPCGSACCAAMSSTEAVSGNDDPLPYPVGRGNPDSRRRWAVRTILGCSSS
jgi:hypothetical protein